MENKPINTDVWGTNYLTKHECKEFVMYTSPENIEIFNRILDDVCSKEIDKVVSDKLESDRISFQAAMDYYEAKNKEIYSKIENLFTEYQSLNNKNKK